MQGQTPCCVGVEIEQIIFDHELGQRVVHARRAAAAAAATLGTMGREFFLEKQYCSSFLRRSHRFDKISELIQCLLKAQVF